MDKRRTLEERLRLYTFEAGDDDVLLGAEWQGGLIDLSAAHATFLGSQRMIAAQPLSGYISDLLDMGPRGMQAARDAIRHFIHLPALEQKGLWHPFDEVELWPPIPDAGKILCCALNFIGQLKPNPSTVDPASPCYYAKLPNTIIGPGEPIVRPRLTQHLDFGVQLAAVIGQQMKHVAETDALASVAGYTILHDVSVHDVPNPGNEFTLARNFDTFAPIGPCLVTTDEMPDPANLRLRTLLNGEVAQDACTSDTIFSLPRLLADLSSMMTLEPGDIVTIGTPAAVGKFRDSRVTMQPGDLVTLEIEGIGTLENPVVAEP